MSANDDKRPTQRSQDSVSPPSRLVREVRAPAFPGSNLRTGRPDPALAANDSQEPSESLPDMADSGAALAEEGETAGEGVEKEQLEAEDGARIAEPFDPTKIRITTRQPSVDIVIERIRENEIDLQPDFQRAGNIWSRATKSRLIESLLLRIPLPVFYMAANEDDNWQVVDGLQRLGTLRDFVDKKLRLRGLEYLSQLENQSYDDLPRPMQRRINETQLSCHIIEPGTPPEVMYNVFKRINTEGKPLKGQEVRHALNPGPARDLLRELADSAEFLRATDRSVSPLRMADRECVLRFLAFRSLGVGSYEGKLDDFLLRAMRALNTNDSGHAALAGGFRRAMSLASEIFGREAFRKPRRPGYGKWRSPVNKPLFECLSVALAEVGASRSDILLSRKDEVVSGLTGLMGDAEFIESISVGTQTTRMVGIRFGRIRALVRGLAS